MPGWAKLAIGLALGTFVFVVLAGLIGVLVYTQVDGNTGPRALVAVAHNYDDRRPELITRQCPGRSVGSAEARDGGPTGAVIWSATAKPGSPGLTIMPMSGDVPGYTVTGDVLSVPPDRLVWISVKDDKGVAVGAAPIELRTEDLSDRDVNIGVGADKGAPTYQQRIQFVKQIEC